MAPRLLFILNDAPFFVSHRLVIADAARSAGYDVHLAAPHDASCRERIAQAGITWHDIPLDRSGSSLAAEWRTFRAIQRMLTAVRPDIVHNVTIKPVLYGSIARRLAGGGPTVNAVPGLGYVFLSRGLKAAVRRRVVESLYGLALGGRDTTAIFQNPDDLGYFVRRGLVSQRCTVLIPGSGVDLRLFVETPIPDGPPLVVLPARMLRDKGVLEFVGAAERLKPEFPDARFVLIGGTDVNRAAVPEAELKRLASAGAVEWWGPRSDMPAILASSSIVVLPSYREGVPKTLLEAAAAGRPMVTTDVPGCRDVVRHGVDGLLVPPRTVEPLADAIGALLRDRARMQAMGTQARQRAIAEFSVERVTRETLATYASLLQRDTAASRGR